MQAAHLAEAVRARHEHRGADSDPRVGTGADYSANRLVAGDEGIAHAGKLRHPAAEQQPFGPGADAGPTAFDDDLVGTRLVERERSEREALRLLDDNGERFHHRDPYASPFSSSMCHCNRTL